MTFHGGDISNQLCFRESKPIFKLATRMVKSNTLLKTKGLKLTIMIPFSAAHTNPYTVAYYIGEYPQGFNPYGFLMTQYITTKLKTDLS